MLRGTAVRTADTSATSKLGFDSWLRNRVPAGPWIWGVSALVVPGTWALAALGGHGSTASAVVALSCVIVAYLFSLEADPHDRTIFILLFVVGLGLRMLALVCFSAWLDRAGGAYLSPDGTTYWRTAQAMAEGRLDLTAGAITTFGAYDVASYYYFGALARLFGNDLFVFQLVNVGLSSLVAPLMFAWARRVVPTLALALGAALALHPSLVFMSTVNLLKDPSVVFASVAVVWAVTGMLGGRPRPRWLMYLVVGVTAASYLRFGRFYALLYLAVGFGATVVILPLVAQWRATRAAKAAGGESYGPDTPAAPRWVDAAIWWLALIAIFGTVELVAVRAGWPPAPLQAVRQVQSSVQSPGMSRYAPGLAEARGTSVTLTWPANAVRRLFGPFVWILPTHWDARSLVSADYLLYPGMIIWYACLPFILAGLVRVAYGAWRGIERRVSLIALFVFCAVYFAQFMTINLSYRQRDDTLPFLLVFAGLGFVGVRHSRAWRTLYAGYWAALVLMAVVHLVVRGRGAI